MRTAWRRSETHAAAIDSVRRIVEKPPVYPEWEELLQKLQTRFATDCPVIPPAILADLRAGILASPLIEDEIKPMVR